MHVLIGNVSFPPFRSADGGIDHQCLKLAHRVWRPMAGFGLPRPVDDGWTSVRGITLPYPSTRLFITDIEAQWAEAIGQCSLHARSWRDCGGARLDCRSPSWWNVPPCRKLRCATRERHLVMAAVYDRIHC